MCSYTVPHGKLIQKLGYYGVRGKVQNLIKAFLTGRLQRVVVNGEASKWHNVEVVEKRVAFHRDGTGPHLFLLFINDINHVVRGATRLFASSACCIIKSSRQLMNYFCRMILTPWSTGLRHGRNEIQSQQM